MGSSESGSYPDALLLPVRMLRTGDLTCMYEAGNLRYIKFRDAEVLRMIYGAVRDEKWEGDDSFCITYTAFHNGRNIQYKALFKIEGAASNRVSVVFRGTALSDFKKNRIGLCVHHPLKECCGREVCVTATDGNLESVRKGDSIEQRIFLTCSGVSKNKIIKKKNPDSLVATAITLPKIGYCRMEEGYNAIKRRFFFIQVGYGTGKHFAELNRNRPQSLPHDFVSFSLTPQVHATDTRSMIENLECQPDILRTIRSFTDKGIHISPVSFKNRLLWNMQKITVRRSNLSIQLLHLSNNGGRP